jgi:DNA-binding NtrC family response regulator
MHMFQSEILKSTMKNRSHFPVLAGTSIVAHATRQMVDLAASVYDPLFISGPQGSGKAAIAHAVHMVSSLAAKEFAAFDCANISKSDRKTIFTIGLNWPGTHFVGNILLDEIGQLDAGLQDALRRWLTWNQEQNRQVRLIATSSHSLDELSAKGEFDPALRLLLSKLAIPAQPLSRRRPDIPALMMAIWANNHLDLPPRLNRAAWKMLEDRPWNGNFIELQRLADSVSRAFGGKTIGPQQLSRLLAIRTVHHAAPHGIGEQADSNMASPYDLKTHLAREEAILLIAALERSRGVIKQAARLAGIDGVRFQDKMRQYGIALPESEA